MSFLASLRQESNTEPGLRLCYRLSFSERSRCVRLSLRLAGFNNGHPMDAGKPYQLDAAQLRQAPPFLLPADLDILWLLLSEEPDWQGQSKARLPRTRVETLVRKLLASERCFVASHSMAPLSLGADQMVEAGWQMQADASQRVHWQCQQPDAMVVCAPSADSAALVWHRRAGQLSFGRSPMAAEALNTLDGQAPVAAQGTEHFHTLNAAQWRTQGLPLPVLLPCEQLEVRMSPVLCCRVAGQGMSERLQLQFRYQCQALSFVVAAGGEAETVYFPGHQCVWAALRLQQREGEFQDQLEAQLNAFTPASEPGVWRANRPEAWQHLLLELRETVEEQGFVIQVDPGFAYHFVKAERWQLELSKVEKPVVGSADAASDGSLVALGVEQHNTEWQLAIQVEAGNQRLDLLQLLRELRDEREQQADAIITLEDGRRLVLDAGFVSGLGDELADLLQRGRYHLPRSQLNRLHSVQQLLPASTECYGDVDALKSIDSLYSNPAVISSQPQGLQATLRPYQWLGVCWLQHLAQHRANGLLADDMGLGKTLQTLAHLCLEQQQGCLSQPALVVAPTSLLHNWRNEALKFAPELNVRIVHGPGRHKYWGSLANYELLLTSYSLVVNDQQRWAQQPLSWLILDEAQQIKNPRTRARQALRQLTCARRLCLSGTPVENHLGELWSVMDFLMPDCLGSEREFKHHYRHAIERDGDGSRMQQLLQRIAPFILRREKDQVAQDLPEKTLIEQTIDMADDQRLFYQQLKQRSWHELRESLQDTDSPAQQQVMVLNGLLKLRQACCDPALLGHADVRSAKREHCIDMIQSLVDEQRAILVFSQFTTMLSLLAEDLEERGIDHLMLTGQTHQRQRQQLVDAFQAGQVPVFLISLKAGGLGLNLTRADTVIHYDPWWNQAAEQQATDRAHRIGQDKPVFVYKLITEDSIEKKIAQLQAHKAQLSQHVNDQGRLSAESFSLKLDELLALWE